MFLTLIDETFYSFQFVLNMVETLLNKVISFLEMGNFDYLSLILILIYSLITIFFLIGFWYPNLFIAKHASYMVEPFLLLNTLQIQLFLVRDPLSEKR
jgi:hypothetical protein